MQKFIEKLQFITHDIALLTHVEQAEKACEAGAKWIQYRCLTKNDAALLKDINKIAAICDDWGATLIVTDHVRFAGEADIQGFHIEDMDADFIALRKLVGAEFTLGASANTVENLIRFANEGADYAGFGPFAPTTTKSNEGKNILGVKGYEAAVKALNESGIDLPFLAVGGVTLNDVDALLQTGVYGIAVSAAINYADDFEAAYRAFYDMVVVNR